MRIIDRIDELVEERKKVDVSFSASKMMKELGFSNGMHSQWKSGTKEPSKKSIVKIADYLGTTPEYLQYGIESDKSESPPPSDEWEQIRNTVENLPRERKEKLMKQLQALIQIELDQDQ